MHVCDKQQVRECHHLKEDPAGTAPQAKDRTATTQVAGVRVRPMASSDRSAIREALTVVLDRE